jgi:hypothetical protein
MLEGGCCTKNMTSTGGCSYSFVYSWWWVWLTPETCRVNLRNKKYTALCCISLDNYRYRSAMHGTINIKKTDTFIVSDFVHLEHKFSVIIWFVFITNYATFTYSLTSHACDPMLSRTALRPVFRPTRFWIMELPSVSCRSITGRIHFRGCRVPASLC